MPKRKKPYERKKPGLENKIVGFNAGDDIIRPNSLPQLRFIQSTAFECFYAGGAGAGKTFALLLAAAKYHNEPSFRAIIFRNTMDEVRRVLKEESDKLYPHLGGVYNHTAKTWTFPSGAKIMFSYLQENKHLTKHLGAEYQFVGFDELVTFQEDQFTGLMKRLRTSSKANIPRQIRATSNPYCDWVFYRYFHWLNHPHKECIEKQEISGKPECPYSGKTYEINGVATQVIMGTVQDNAALIRGTPEYIATLKSGNPLQVAYYYYNDWTIRPAAGTYFKREKFEFIDAAPADAKRIRGWDLAATLGGGDATVGIRLAYKNGIYYVEDMIRERLDSAGVKDLILSTAELDGKSCQISLPREVAGAGKFLQAEYSKVLNGFVFSFRPETGDKETKAMNVSAQVMAGGSGAQGNVKIVRGPWNYDFIQELEEFPDGRHDDIVDAFAGAYNSTIGQVYLSYKRYGNIRPRQLG